MSDLFQYQIAWLTQTAPESPIKRARRGLGATNGRALVSLPRTAGATHGYPRNTPKKPRKGSLAELGHLARLGQACHVELSQTRLIPCPCA